MEYRTYSAGSSDASRCRAAEGGIQQLHGSLPVIAAAEDPAQLRGLEGKQRQFISMPLTA